MTIYSGYDSIAVLNCGVGNIGSISNVLKKKSLLSEVISEPHQLERFQTLILPGVGSFGGFMRRLRERGLEPAIVDFANNPDNRIIGICVGMQVLLEVGYEHGEHRGLGLVPGCVKKFKSVDPSCRVPHVGWNTVEFRNGRFISQDGDYYFTHSYCASIDEECILGTAIHGERIVAALHKGNVLGFQFHPEKSGKSGMELLQMAANREAI